MHKSKDVEVDQVSDALLRTAGSMCSPQQAAAALAVALGRVCSQPDVDVEDQINLVRLVCQALKDPPC